MPRASTWAIAVAAVALLLSPARAQHWTYGKGCAGLQFVWKGSARINTVLTAKLTTLPAIAAAPGLVVIGWPWPCKPIPQNLTRVPGCSACVYPIATWPILTDVWGVYYNDIGIPGDRSLIGLAVAIQFYLWRPPVLGDVTFGSSNAGWFIVRS